MSESYVTIGLDEDQARALDLISTEEDLTLSEAAGILFQLGLETFAKEES